MHTYHTPSLFPEYDKRDGNETAKFKAKQRRVEQKNKIFGLDLCAGAKFCGKYGIPQVDVYKDTLPERFITFSEIASTGSPYVGVTCYDYDYLLEALWRTPYKYIATLAQYKCFAMPDLSLRVGDPLAVQISNAYRNHAIAYYLQQHGVKMLPAPSWAATPSFDFCFDGYGKGGAVLISTIGVLGDERSLMYFILGFKEMLKRLSPDAIVLYGDVNDEILSLIPSQLHVQFACHGRFNRARHGK